MTDKQKTKEQRHILRTVTGDRDYGPGNEELVQVQSIALVTPGQRPGHGDLVKKRARIVLRGVSFAATEDGGDTVVEMNWNMAKDLRDLLGLVLVVLLLAACADGFETRRQAALAIAEAFCGRLVSCGDLPDTELQACVELGVSTPCSSLDCNEPPGPDVQLCLDAIAAQGCSDSNPALCVGVL